MPASLTRTTLAVAITNTYQNVISVASATGIVAGYGLYIDREYMVVTKVSGTAISVFRGAGGTRSTPHLVGSSVFVGPQNYFTTVDRAGAGTAANEIVQPYINIANGNVWSVVGGAWQKDNTYGGSTGYGLSPAIWSDCPLQGMTVDPGYGSFDGDDFVGNAGGPLATAHKYVLAGANGTMGAVGSVAHGALVLTGPGTDNDEAYLIAGAGAMQIKTDAASSWWFEARVKINQIATSQGQFVGLSSEAGADFITDNTMVLKVVDLIGFQILTATDIAPTWRTVHSLTSGAIVAVQSSVSTPAADTYQKLGMKCVAGTVTFFVDGVPLASTALTSATNFPLNKFLAAVFATKCGSAAANTLTIDWWKVAQSRIAN